MTASRPFEPAVTRIIAVRHGETAWNVDSRIQGQLDIALNARGQWQALRVARALQSETIEAIYASDLVRAHATAQAIGVASGVSVQTDAGLRERGFGAFEGQTWSDIEQRWPAASALWRARDLAFAPDGGETIPAFYARAVSTTERLAARHPGATVVLVAHGGVMDCLYRAAARIDLAAARTWQLGNAAINRLLYSPQGFALVGWSDTAHLDGPLFGEPLDEFHDRAAPVGGQAAASGR